MRPGRACECVDAIRHARHAPVGHESENSPHGGGSTTSCTEVVADIVGHGSHSRIRPHGRVDVRFVSFLCEAGLKWYQKPTRRSHHAHSISARFLIKYIVAHFRNRGARPVVPSSAHGACLHHYPSRPMQLGRCIPTRQAQTQMLGITTGPRFAMQKSVVVSMRTLYGLTLQRRSRLSYHLYHLCTVRYWQPLNS